MEELLLKSEGDLCKASRDCGGHKKYAFQIGLQGAYLTDSLNHCALKLMALLSPSGFQPIDEHSANKAGLLECDTGFLMSSLGSRLTCSLAKVVLEIHESLSPSSSFLPASQIRSACDFMAFPASGSLFVLLHEHFLHEHFPSVYL